MITGYKYLRVWWFCQNNNLLLFFRTVRIYTLYVTYYKNCVSLLAWRGVGKQGVVVVQNVFCLVLFLFCFYHFITISHPQIATYLAVLVLTSLVLTKRKSSTERKCQKATIVNDDISHKLNMCCQNSLHKNT